MILVTGGTGLVGSHLLYSLLKDNNTVRAIHRKDSDLEAVKKVFSYYTHDAEVLFKKIEWVEANILDIPTLTEAFKGVTHVYHAAAYISFNPKHYRKLKKANVEGTANIVNLCLANSIKKLCYVSSVATLGAEPSGFLMNEESAWNPEDDNSVYAITKYGAEMQVWRGTQEGLNAVIVNPGVVLGEGLWDSGSGIIFKRASKNTSYYTSGGTGIVDVRDVVKAMIALMNSPVVNKNFVLVAKNIYYKELLSELAVLFNKNPPFKQLSKNILTFLRILDGFSSRLFGSRRHLVKSTVRSLCKVSFYDGSKIEGEVDFTYTPHQETLRRIAEAFKKDA
ncbi:nucleoside-diphosphate-sugar epimerase [Ulvibacter sp. MAR_2010_11]|uniref:NAD-dependent epimerase/dehydratase family protein n=1 Tax=Ulvibacter sp. MAR_2010_11 TaxID=1250229 RepID=UPI000C2CC9F9|nr:NAD-dependent epimerase/dehydratase family protein [Ulvibacter sp. MAR_2010_11]PKA82663.1 nucleoside-diphosphate-sugar epimerase [Ulvibacter sp. MAR_2010_11]